jgi:hypothetical protein
VSRLGFLAVALVFAALSAVTLRADLAKARAENNLEKRSGLALDNAVVAYDTARAAYEKGDSSGLAAAVAEMQESVELAYKSLKATGKDPRRSPKWFKRAEIRTRELLRKLDAFQQDMSFTERPMLDGAKAQIQKVHDDLLLGLMEGKKK